MPRSSSPDLMKGRAADRAVNAAVATPASHRLTLHVQYACEDAGLPARSDLRRWARAALKGVDGPVELGVRIVDTAESAALNERYRGKAGPTNVLSFSYDVGELTPCFLGDLIICAPVVRQEAQAQGKPADAHWAHMIVHGIMHLRGYDHMNDDEAKIMEELEADILQTLGFPNPYSCSVVD